MPDLVKDPVPLRRLLADLTALKKARRLPPDGAEAFAECCFRLAVNPGTAGREALSLLKRAHRVDGVNPKFAYHIARIYFVHGELDRASSWLAVAVRQCPTSHRLWSHVALLQRDLNERYRGNDQYEPDDLRRRGADVDRLVREGADRFEGRLLEFSPRRSAKAKAAHGTAGQARSRDAAPETDGAPARTATAAMARDLRRLSGAGRCRWSGVRDLAAEDLLHAEPSDHMRAQILPHLKFAARVADSRPGGVSAFAILGIEWLVCGYPADTVLTLRRTISPALQAPSLALLDEVAAICTEALDRLPARLAAGVAHGSLPPLLAALLHRRLLLTVPTGVRHVGRYHAARRLLADIDTRPPADAEARARAFERARGLHQDMVSAVASLSAAAADSRAGAPAEAGAVPDAEAASHELETIGRAADELRQLRDEAVRDIRSRLGPTPLTPAAAAQLVVDRDAGKEIAQALATVAEAASARLDAVLAAMAASAPDPGWLRQHGPRASRVRRALNRILYSPSLAGVMRQAEEAASAVTGGAEHAVAIPAVSGGLSRVLSAIPLALPSASDDGARAVSPGERIAAISRDARETEATLERHWAALRAFVTAHKQGALSGADLEAAAAIRDYVGGVDSVREQSLKDLHAAREAKPAPDKAALALLDETVARLQNIQLGRFRTQLQKLPLPARTAPAAPNASAVAVPAGQSGPEGTAGVAPPTGAPAGIADRAAEPPASAASDPFAALRHAVAEFERAVDGSVARAMATFEAYSPEALVLPPLQALRMSVQARQAEVLYRLGRRHDARAAWVGLLREDRLDAHALKNVAVCDTHGPEAGRALASWRAYAEVLCFLDVLAGSPRPHARIRADFHRAYGQAFAPALVSESKRPPDEKIDERALLSFLDSTGRVRQFVDHTLLACLNAKLAFTSPPLLLGIRRTEGTDAQKRKRAREQLLTFVEQCRDLLPPRIREAFADTVRGHIEAAYAACESPQRLTQDRDPAYSKEEPDHEAWLRTICEMKYRLFVAIRDSEELPKSIGSLGFLAELTRIDRIPIRQSASFLEPEMRRYKTNDGAVLAEMMSHLRDHVVSNLLRFVFGAGTPAADEGLRQRQYRRLVDAWVRQPALDDDRVLKKIDDPQPYYPDHVLGAFRDVHPDPPEPAIDTLRQWTQRYPELTGPARLLAILLANARQFDEATTVLDSARTKGFYPKGRQQCVDLLHQLGVQRDNIALESGRFDEALPSLLDRLDRDDASPDLARTVVGAFLQIAKQNRSVEGHGRVAQAVESWSARARERLAGAEGDAGSLSEEAIGAVEESLAQALVQAFLVPVGDLNASADWDRVAQLMTQLLSVHPTVADAYYYRMLAWNQLAARAGRAKDRERFRSLGQNALADASAVLERSTNPAHREQADTLRKQVEDVLTRN